VKPYNGGKFSAKREGILKFGNRICVLNDEKN